MSVYVLNLDGTPLMPCTSAKARKLLRDGKAKRVVHRTPFTIQLNWQCEGITQEVIAGMDTGSKKLGCAAVTNGKVVYAAEVELNNGISKKMKRRATYRRTRRDRKTRYRPTRYNNRAASKREGRLAPSIQSKLNSHKREKRFVESILPVTKWVVETAQFDIHKITDPDVVDYQDGPQKGYRNVKAYVLHRDGYKCQRKEAGVKHSKKLQVHHIVRRRAGGSDAPDNLITYCESCHEDLHAGKWEPPKRRRRSSKTKHATHMGIVQARLKQSDWEFEETFGYLTKLKREQLGLPKTHANDAIAICCEDGEIVGMPEVIYYKKHVSAGDYRQTRGKRSEQRLPTGKLFGMRKFDLISTSKGVGFVKGKRSDGKFVLADIFNQVITASANVKKNCTRITARSTTLLVSLPGGRDFRRDQ